MLKQRPGAYAWLGAMRADENPSLHAPRFDFNDALIPQGAALWLQLIDMATVRPSDPPNGSGRARAADQAP